MGQTLSCLKTPPPTNDVRRRQVARRTVDAAEVRRPAKRRTTVPANNSATLHSSTLPSLPPPRSDSAPVCPTEPAENGDKPLSSTRQEPRSDRSAPRSEPSRLASDLGSSERAPEPAWRTDVKRRTEAVKRASSPVRRASSSLDSIGLQGRRLSSPVPRSPARRSHSVLGHTEGVLEQRARRHTSVDARGTVKDKSSKTAGDGCGAKRDKRAVTGHGPPLHEKRQVRFEEAGGRGIAWRRGHEPKDSLDEVVEGVDDEKGEVVVEGEWANLGKSLVQLGIEKFDSTARDGSPPTRTIVTREPSRIEHGVDRPDPGVDRPDPDVERKSEDDETMS